jgi:hypothetical protein
MVLAAAEQQPVRFRSALARSPIPGVSDGAWARFVHALEVQPIRAVSESGGCGAYDLRPRRLVELGYAEDLRLERTQGGRQVYACRFKAPWTQDRFLADPVAQAAALRRSMVLYHEDLQGGAIRRPDGVSLAGALAILHRGGRGALEAWPDLFHHTRALYEAAQGAF